MKIKLILIGLFLLTWMASYILLWFQAKSVGYNEAVNKFNNEQKILEELHHQKLLKIKSTINKSRNAKKIDYNISKDLASDFLLQELQ